MLPWSTLSCGDCSLKDCFIFVLAFGKTIWFFQIVDWCFVHKLWMQNLPRFVSLLSYDIPFVVMLQYKNVRPDYLKNIWKVINWHYANEVYEKESEWGVWERWASRSGFVVCSASGIKLIMSQQWGTLFCWGVSFPVYLMYENRIKLSYILFVALCIFGNMKTCPLYFCRQCCICF